MSDPIAHFLVSYYFFNDHLMEKLLEGARGLDGLKIDLIADSGSFTAWSKGAEIDIREYSAA